jgi:hypothetical protein
MFLKICKEKLQKNITLKQESMKANELRIGNLTYRIEVKNKNNTVIDDITIYDMERIQEVYDKTFTYEPILLTEDWLLKFGFEKNKSIWILNEIEISSWFTFRFSLEPLKVQEIDFVHQLQNLYFALTNKELEYNNKM